MITFVDSDDWIEPDMYWNMMEVYSRYEPDIVSSGLIYDYKTGARKVECDLVEGRYDRSRIEREVLPVMMHDARKNRRAVTSSVCTKMIRKKLWNEVTQNMDHEITYGEDAAVLYLCIAKASDVIFINNAWYHYRVHDDSQVRSYNIHSFKKIKRFQDYMEAEYRNLKIWTQMEKQLQEYVRQFLYPAIDAVYGIQLGGPVYLFPYELVQAGCQVVIYGAGVVGRAYMENMDKSNYAKVVSWVDQSYDKLPEVKYQVYPPDVLSEINFDYVVIAIEECIAAQSVKKALMNMGISSDKIVWKQPERF